MQKCCYITFSPSSSHNTHSNDELCLAINDQVIKEVSHTKFLGVTIDNKLSWDKHLSNLRQKLYYAMSTLSRIKESIPETLHNDLYYTLFESHLTYCISVWGGVSEKKMASIHKMQKKAIRVMFGDTESFKDKFMTCCRTRSFGNQKLGEEFYTKEHTKPLFKLHKILAVQNLYFYHLFMETFRLLKFQSPVTFHSLYELSNRKYLTYTQLNPPKVSDHFIYRSSIIWNKLRPKLQLTDMSCPILSTKNKLKQILLFNQHKHNDTEWLPSHDFNLDLV